jgi:GNAT superfamily N-acetyltransferase
MALVWQVFSEFEAPVYAPEGVEEFRTFIRTENIMGKMQTGEMRLFGAFPDGALRGMLADRGAGHISLLFVQKEFHRQGISRALFAHYADVCREAGVTGITVNSSPYAVEIYRKLGFAETGAEQTQNGIRFTPMASSLQADY